MSRVRIRLSFFIISYTIVVVCCVTTFLFLRFAEKQNDTNGGGVDLSDAAVDHDTSGEEVALPDARRAEVEKRK